MWSLLILTLPALLWAVVRGHRMQSQPRVGLHGAVTKLSVLNNRRGEALSGAAQRAMGALDILAGKLSLVGPRPLAVGEEPDDLQQRRSRRTVRPGLVSDWRVRQRTNCAYKAEFETDCEALQDDHRCGRYAERPRVCRQHGDRAELCEHHAEEEPYAVRFSSALEFEAYLDGQGLKWRRKKNSR